MAVFTVHAKTSLLYTFQRSMEANRNINLWQEKAPIYMLSRSKAPKTQQICHYKHTRKTSELFLLFNAGVDFSLRNNFANSGSFTKVSVPVHNYNSLFYIHSLLELSHLLLLFSYSSITGIILPFVTGIFLMPQHASITRTIVSYIHPLLDNMIMWLWAGLW